MLALLQITLASPLFAQSVASDRHIVVFYSAIDKLSSPEISAEIKEVLAKAYSAQYGITRAECDRLKIASAQFRQHITTARALRLPQSQVSSATIYGVDRRVVQALFDQWYSELSAASKLNVASRMHLR